MLAAAKLLLSGVFGKLLKAASAVIEWALSDWRNGPLAISALALAVHVLVIDPGLRKARDAAQTGWNGEKRAHDRTVQGYRIAARTAQARANANAARVESAQLATTKEIVDDYESRIAAARARARVRELERVRRETAARADPGGAGAAGVPGVPTAAAAADEAPADHRLSAGGQPLTTDERLIATEQAIQLDALIEWTLRQGKIRSTPEQAGNGE